MTALPKCNGKAEAAVRAKHGHNAGMRGGRLGLMGGLAYLRQRQGRSSRLNYRPSVRPTRMAMQANNNNRTPTTNPALDASRCTSS